MHLLHNFSNRSYRNKIWLSHFLFFIALDEDLWIYLLFVFFNKFIKKLIILYNVKNYFYYINSCRHSISVFILNRLDSFIINTHLYAYTYIYFMIKNLCMSYLSLFLSLCLYLFGTKKLTWSSFYNINFFSSYKLPNIDRFEDKYLFYSNYRNYFISNCKIINNLSNNYFFLSKFNLLSRNKKKIRFLKIKEMKWLSKKKYILLNDSFLLSLFLNLYLEFYFIIEKQICLYNLDTFLNFIIS